MKRTFLFIASAFLALSSFAGGNEAESAKKKGEGVLSHGFYLNIGLGFPVSSSTIIDNLGYSSSFNGYGFVNGQSRSIGLQPSLEIGNQWYFWHNKTVGIGLKVSWLQFGYSSYTNSYGTGVTNIKPYQTLDVRLLKLAPQVSIAFNDDIALDFSFEVSPTYQLSGDGYNVANKDYANVNMNFGALLAPGIRFRYKVYAVGFDYGFGKLAATSTQVIDSDTKATYTGTTTWTSPRVYLGFQF